MSIEITATLTLTNLSDTFALPNLQKVEVYMDGNFRAALVCTRFRQGWTVRATATKTQVANRLTELTELQDLISKEIRERSITGQYSIVAHRQVPAPVAQSVGKEVLISYRDHMGMLRFPVRVSATKHGRVVGYNTELGLTQIFSEKNVLSTAQDIA